MKTLCLTGTSGNILYDFRNLQTMASFPEHGWAVNSQGIKLLHLPIVDLLDKQGLLFPNIFSSLPLGTNHAAQGFVDTIRRLTISLRELHAVITNSCDHEAVGSLTILDDRAFELVPVFTEASISYLRRPPDLLVHGCRTLLFQKWQNVPLEFKGWIRQARELQSFAPRHDISELLTLLGEDAAWFEGLRGQSKSSGFKGLRDALEHRPVRLIVSKSQVQSAPPTYQLCMWSTAGDVDRRVDLLDELKPLIAGLCRLMKAVHLATGFNSNYTQQSVLFVTGNDDDGVGF